MTTYQSHSTPVPPTKIRPLGWLKSRLEVQAAGLTGNIDEFWPDIRDSGWIGGTAEGWERGPYWLDGLVPLAFLLGDARLVEKAHRWVGYIVDHQQADGWIGPETQNVEKGSHTRDPWPLYVALKALTQYYDATTDDRVRACVERTLQAIDIHLDRHPLANWAQFRWQDLLVTIMWMMDHGGDKKSLGKLARRIFDEGYDWTHHFREFRFADPADRWQYDSHVVNNAMGIKAPGLWRHMAGRSIDAAEVLRPIEVLDRYHGQVTGVFSGDECLAGRSPSRGTELCAVVEYMYSLETLLAVVPDVELSDRLESIAFNALPATLKPDMWAHQYDQQVNQALCALSDPPVFGTNGPDANLYGLEPNFGCCTANLHQGYPKFASHLLLSSPDGNLRLTSYAPAAFTASHEALGDVEVEVAGNYPFSDHIVITARSSRPSTTFLELPVPSWAEGATLAKASDKASDGLEPGGLHRVAVPPGDRTTLHLHLPARLRAEFRTNRAVSFCRGPLVYALAIDEDWRKVGGEEPHADWEVHPKSSWNVAVALDPADPTRSLELSDPNQARTSGHGGESGGATGTAAAADDPFANPAAAPTIHARGGGLESWQLDRGAAEDPPVSPVRRPNDETEVRLVPYGVTNLRIAEIPWYVAER